MFRTGEVLRKMKGTQLVHNELSIGSAHKDIKYRINKLVRGLLAIERSCTWAPSDVVSVSHHLFSSFCHGLFYVVGVYIFYYISKTIEGSRAPYCLPNMYSYVNNHPQVIFMILIFPNVHPWDTCRPKTRKQMNQMANINSTPSS